MAYVPNATDVAQPTDAGVLAATAASEFRTIKTYLRDILLAGLNLRAPLASPTFTGTVTAPAFSGPTTGAHNGTVGATTPAAVAATTVSANSIVTAGAGSTTGYAYFESSNTSGNFRAGVESSAGNALVSGAAPYAAVVGTVNAKPLHLFTNNAVQATIDAAGNLGLGVVPSASGNTKNIELPDGSTLASRNSGGVPQFYLSSNGVGTGYASTYKVNGKAAQIQLSGLDGAIYFSTYGTGVAGAAWGAQTGYMTLDVNGSLTNVSKAPGGIGVRTTCTDASSAYNTGFQSNLPATSSLGWHFRGESNGVLNAAIYYNGNFGSVTNVYGGISDIKVKENITDATPKLPQLMRVRIVNYNLKTGPGLKQLGVIAQELELIFPGLVEETSDFIEVTKTREVVKTAAVTVKQEQITTRTVTDIVEGKAVQAVITESTVAAAHKIIKS